MELFCLELRRPPTLRLVRGLSKVNPAEPHILAAKLLPDGVVVRLDEVNERRLGKSVLLRFTDTMLEQA